MDAECLEEVQIVAKCMVIDDTDEKCKEIESAPQHAEQWETLLSKLVLITFLCHRYSRERKKLNKLKDKCQNLSNKQPGHQVSLE